MNALSDASLDVVLQQDQGDLIGCMGKRCRCWMISGQ
jgi:hypothetical protein